MWLSLLMAAVIVSADEPAGTIRFSTDAKVIEFRPDGKKLKETAIEPDEEEKLLSPDGKLWLFIKDHAVFVRDKDGGKPRRVSREGQRCTTPIWSPDGSQVAYLGRLNDRWQLHIAGSKIIQVTEWGEGVEKIAYSPGGKLTYLRPKVHEGKFTPSDLVVTDIADHKVLVKDTFISDYAWSPDGKWLAYGKLHALVIIDVAKDKAKEIALTSISELMDHNAPNNMAWSPDSQAIACRIPAYVSRAGVQFGELPPKIFGDDELFVVPREGKPHWFIVGDVRGKIEWTK